MDHLPEPQPRKIDLSLRIDYLRYFANEKPGWKLAALCVLVLPSLVFALVVARHFGLF
jgi:hypothetical protein